MAYPVGQYYIDGSDLYMVFGITVESGSDDLLKFPSRKESISHNWQDENGIDVDLSRVFFEAREATFSCNFIANSQADFWTKYNSFIYKMMQPGLRRLEVSEFDKSFYVYYKDCPSYARYTKIKKGPDAGKILCKFQITFVESKPVLDSSNVYIITDDTKFLIT